MQTEAERLIKLFIEDFYLADHVTYLPNWALYQMARRMIRKGWVKR